MKLCIGEAGSNFNSEQSALCLQSCPCDAFWGTRLSNTDYLLSTCCIQALGQEPAAQKQTPPPCPCGAHSQFGGAAAPQPAAARGALGALTLWGPGLSRWVSYSVPVLRTAPVSACKPSSLLWGERTSYCEKITGKCA